jgi:hypothetical protein
MSEQRVSDLQQFGRTDVVIDHWVVLPNEMGAALSVLYGLK